MMKEKIDPTIESVRDKIKLKAEWKKIFEAFKDVLDPLKMFSTDVIFYRGIKISKTPKKTGPSEYLIEDTATSVTDNHGNVVYNPVTNKLLLELLKNKAIQLKDENRQKEIRTIPAAETRTNYAEMEG